MKTEKVTQLDGFKLQRRSLSLDAVRESGLVTHKITLVTGAIAKTDERKFYDVAVSEDESLVIMRKVDGREIAGIGYKQTSGGLAVCVDLVGLSGTR